MSRISRRRAEDAHWCCHRNAGREGCGLGEAGNEKSGYNDGHCVLPLHVSWAEDVDLRASRGRSELCRTIEASRLYICVKFSPCTEY